MPEFFYPIQDGQLGRAAYVNERLQDIEDGILARAGVLAKIIAWTTLAVDSATITMDIPVAAYPTLVLHANLRSNRGGGNGWDSVRLTINDDTSTTYSCNYVQAAGNTIQGLSSSATSGCEMGYVVTDALGNASNLGALVARIGQANVSAPKVGTFHGSAQAASGATVQMSFGGLFYPTAAVITRLKLTVVNGTVFTAGSKYALYGTS